MNKTKKQIKHEVRIELQQAIQEGLVLGFKVSLCILSLLIFYWYIS